MASALRRHGVEEGITSIVARVIIECPGALQRRWAEIIRVAGDRVAGRIADRAIDTFDTGAGLDAGAGDASSNRASQGGDEYAHASRRAVRAARGGAGCGAGRVGSGWKAGPEQTE